MKFRPQVEAFLDAVMPTMNEAVCESCKEPCDYHGDICLCLDCQADYNQWDNPRYQKFSDDCLNEGFEVVAYRGRYNYRGPAVSCGDIQAVIRATTVDVQWDQLGKGYIVYPK